METTRNEMTTLAQVQADTLDDSVKRIVLAEQFAEDFLLVADNDYEFYTSLREEASTSELVQLSDSLREEYEQVTEQVVQLVAEHISEVASLLVAQLLQGQGSLPFDLVARQLKERD